MRMRFGVEDERAYFARRDELCTRFAEWAARNASPPTRAMSSCSWTGSGATGTAASIASTPADVEEFLLGWCPRKLASPPELIAGIPDSVAAYVDFLAQERLLATGLFGCRGPQGLHGPRAAVPS